MTETGETYGLSQVCKCGHPLGWHEDGKCWLEHGAVCDCKEFVAQPEYVACPECGTPCTRTVGGEGMTHYYVHKPTQQPVVVYGPEDEPRAGSMAELYAVVFPMSDATLTESQMSDAIQGEIERLNGAAQPWPVVGWNEATERVVFGILRACADGLVVDENDEEWDTPADLALHRIRAAVKRRRVLASRSGIAMMHERPGDGSYWTGVDVRDGSHWRTVMHEDGDLDRADLHERDVPVDILIVEQEAAE